MNIDSSFAATGYMFLLVFVRAHLHRQTSQVEHMKVNKSPITFGMQSAGKGGVSYTFGVYGRSFNFIACQLYGSPDVKRYIKRNQMMGELVTELKVLPSHQNFFEGVETDSLCEFSVIAGDLHYMLNGTYGEFKSQMINPLTQFK